MPASFVGKLAVDGSATHLISFNFANLTDAGGSPAAIASGMVAVIAISADQGSDGLGISATGWTVIGASPDANPVSAVLVRELDGTETTVTISDTGDTRKTSVSVSVYNGIAVPTTAIRTSGSGLGDPDNIDVGAGEIVIVTGHVDDIVVSDYGAPAGMTLAVATSHDGGGGASTTTGIAHDFAPGVGFYNPGEFTGTGSDSDDAYIMVAGLSSPPTDVLVSTNISVGPPILSQPVLNAPPIWATEDYDNNTNTSLLGDGRRWNYHMGYDPAGVQDLTNEHALQRGVSPYDDLLKFEIRGGECLSSDAGQKKGRSELSGSSQIPLEWASEGATPTECWYYFAFIPEAIDGQAEWESFIQIYGMLSVDNQHIEAPIVKFERRNDATLEINVRGAVDITAGNANTKNFQRTIWKSNEDLTLGRIYRWLVRFVPHGETGELRVWLNEVELFNLTNVPIGWGRKTNTYAKFGIYRDEDNLPLQSDYGTSTVIYDIVELGSGTNALLTYATTPPDFQYYQNTRDDGVLTGSVVEDHMVSTNISVGAPTLSTPILTTQNTFVGFDVWNGTTWEQKPVKVWDGALWQTCPVKRWTGTEWV